jgi:diguanylate cyclase (GGDEF)-like protein
MSMTDPLTGLLSRDGLEQVAGPQFGPAAHTTGDYLILYVDVDGLDGIGEQYGRLVGHAMLTHVTGAFKSVIRADDVLARLAGDEFCAIIADPPPRPSVLTERLLTQLDTINDDGDIRYRLSASIGAVTASEFPAAPLDELLARAEERMREHKRVRAADL